MHRWPQRVSSSAVLLLLLLSSLSLAAEPAVPPSTRVGSPSYHFDAGLQRRYLHELEQLTELTTSPGQQQKQQQQQEQHEQIFFVAIAQRGEGSSEVQRLQLRPDYLCTLLPQSHLGHTDNSAPSDVMDMSFV